MKTREYFGRVASLERLNNSPSGNPQWEVHFIPENNLIRALKTAPDSTAGHEIQNFQRGYRCKITVERNLITRVEKAPFEGRGTHMETCKKFDGGWLCDPMCEVI